jgi:hypothetical protein
VASPTCLEFAVLLPVGRVARQPVRTASNWGWQYEKIDLTL